MLDVYDFCRIEITLDYPEQDTFMVNFFPQADEQPLSVGIEMEA
jgi:hypothetical protein